jgi:outer membrane protein TolC
VQAAEAAVSLAQAAWLPGFSFQLNYQRSHTEEVVRPGLAVTLPLFNFGQGPRGEAKARRERARIELTARQATAMAEAEGARDAYRSAVASCAKTARFPLTRTESLARQGYQAGKPISPLSWYVASKRGASMPTVCSQPHSLTSNWE